MATEVINKITITPEAVFDYEYCLFAGDTHTWEECLLAIGCDWQAELLKVGYDKRAVYKQCGYVWKKCLRDTNGDIQQARIAMAIAKDFAEEILQRKWRIALANTKQYQEKAFEYAERFEIPTARLKKTDLKHEVEDYIDLQNCDGRLLYDNYFRCKYLDEKSRQMLMLFLYRDIKMGLMQYWRLEGICFADDWTEEAEEDGKIRHWLKGKITDLEKGDWVIEQMARAEADRILGGFAVQGSIQGLPREVAYAIAHGTNQELAEAIPFLQDTGGEWVGRDGLERKADLSRKLD